MKQHVEETAEEQSYPQSDQHPIEYLFFSVFGDPDIFPCYIQEPEKGKYREYSIRVQCYVVGFDNDRKHRNWTNNQH